MSQVEPQTPHIQADNAREAFEESNKWYRPYFEPLDEYQRIARNKVHPGIDPTLPKYTDGTMASVVQEQPKRVVQQLTTGLVTCKKYPQYAKIADLFHRDELVPYYRHMGDKLQKSWNMIGGALTNGRSASYTWLTHTGTKIHTDFLIPYAKDIIGEKGKVFAPDSNIIFMRAWYQKRDLQAILRREVALKKQDGKHVSEWDLTLLQKFIDDGQISKTSEQMTPAEKEKGSDSSGYEVIHAFQDGIGSAFYSFSPRFESGRPFRTKTNKDPRGKMPIDFMYCNIDLSNPMGRGQVELSAGTQNLMDQQGQMFQFQSTMEMGAPLMVRGSVDKKSLKMRPNTIWDLGSNPTNSVEPYQGSTWALQNYVQNAQFLQSKLFQLNSVQDNSISADSGNVGQSKTQAGVKANEGRIGISDSYLRKQFEKWDADQSETSINIAFSEITARHTMKLDTDDFKEIMKTESAQFVNPDTKELTIPFKEIKDVAFHFQVDASSSEIKEDSDNTEKLLQVYELMRDDPSPEIQQKKVQLLKVIVDEIGAEGTDDLFPELDENNVDEQGNPIEEAPQQPQMTPEMVQQMVMEMIEAKEAEKPEVDPKLEYIKALGIKFEHLPESARQYALEALDIPSDGDPTQPNQKLGIEKFNVAQNAAGRPDEDLEFEEAKMQQAQEQAERSAGFQEDSALLNYHQTEAQAERQAQQAKEAAKAKPAVKETAGAAK